ncbi:hypothetical protein K458DRAFT_307321 [Lentithecium fluviatile CBS 122367]|uniref:Uncharacterized protein n=1 Tax=Lentithecium fluviatile CBS 122367 TaxID=1168545 RepID=A0A6G1IWX8_9PLEO|nr:hypothetical protein K458DRAFT_307321 [Lentithecium fluviatile CBS 122367]
MPAPTPCPVSEIDRTLSPFVNSRDETLKIRRTLSKYLTAGLRPVNAATQNQHLNHECPAGCSVVATNPPGLQNSRKSYLNAIRARVAVQKRHEELQASLEQLQNRNALESPVEVDSGYDGEVTRSYVALLRQRRRFAELQVIQESLEKLLDASPVHGSEDLKNHVKNAIGEQPNLPAERLDRLTEPQNDSSSILKVKKEVLEARSAMDQAKAARIGAQSASRATPSLQEQVYALGCARQEIVEWLQDELVKMEEESGFIEDASPVKRPIEEASAPHLASSESRIRECYNRYTAARSIAIVSHESIQRPPIKNAAKVGDYNRQPDSRSQNGEPLRPARIMTKVLPHLSHLARCDTSERSLLQQAVYLQTQIALADEETSDALLRLSGESHLLPSGTKGIGAWGKTSADIEALNEEFVRARLQDSREEINIISRIVDLCSWQSKVLSSG